MKLTATQLRRIIKEEVTRAIQETPKKKKNSAAAEAEYTKRAIEYFVKDSTVGAGLTGKSYPPPPSKRNPISMKLMMDELMSSRYLDRRPTPEDLEALELAWEEGRKKWGVALGTRR